MNISRNKRLAISIFTINLSFLLLTFSANAASRGITVKAKTSSGVTKEIRLYSGYYALVVGCGDYQSGWPKLPNPIKDAREVATTLKNMGWKVDLLENPEGSLFRLKLSELIVGPGRDKDKGILLWFSGHGYTFKEADGLSLGYLVPIDAPDPEKDEIGFMEKAVSMRYIETVAKRIQAKHVLMAFDSCFSGAIFQMVRAKPSAYIQEKVAEPVRQFITAGNEAEQVPDRSVFKDVFIQGIHKGYADRNNDGYVTGEELGSYLQENVVNYSKKAQHPQFGKINNPKLDKGDFVFLLTSSPPVNEEPVPIEQPESHKEGSRPWIGVSIKEVSNGVLIMKVLPKGPAEEAGIKTNDIVIELNGEKIKTARQFVQTIRDSHVGDMVRLTILRNGMEKVFKVQIANMPTFPKQEPNGRSEKPINETPKVVASDGNYIAYGNGTVKDTRTGLMWASKDNGIGVIWKDAKRYCENYRGGGYPDWRMPTVNELAELYNSRLGYGTPQQNAIPHLTKLIELSHPCQWASDTAGAYFELSRAGAVRSVPPDNYALRVLPVRSDK